MNIVQMDPSVLNPSEYNPRKISEEDKAHLRTSLERFGFVEPLIVNSAESRKNIVIGGHQRLYVALEMKMETVPVFFVEIEDIAKEKELNLRLNRNQGSWDWDKLILNFEKDYLKDIGFKEYELSTDVNPDDFFKDKTAEQKAEDEKPETMICPHCQKEIILED